MYYNLKKYIYIYILQKYIMYYLHNVYIYIYININNLVELYARKCST